MNNILEMFDAKRYIYIVLLIVLISCDKDPIYLENSTIKCLDTPIGMEFFVEEFKGIVTVVDRAMLEELIKSNGDIEKVCTSNITDMGGSFGDDTTSLISYGLFTNSEINQDINTWDVSKVTNMMAMFAGATSFNGDLSSWDVSSVTNMAHMFEGATTFNGNISTWDISSVTDFQGMFYLADAFNQDISKWDVSSVTNMNWMFMRASSFNADVSDWNVKNVSNMKDMFEGATYFNQDLSKWCVINITEKPVGFNDGSALDESKLPKWGTCPNN